MNATGTMEDTGAEVPVIGIGVGGDTGLQECAMLLRHLPPDLGQAVIIAGSDELSAQAWCTRLPVTRVTSDLPLEPGRAYFVPPGLVARVQAQKLRIVPPSEIIDPHRPIDQLFRSLAQARGERARGALLAHPMGDGILGVREIRRMGGLTFATERTQDPLEGDLAADLVLEPDELARVLRKLAPRQAPDWSRAELERLTGLFFVLKEATGTDFSRMRISSVLRQVRRRMTLLGCWELGPYVERLANDPREIERLHRDLCRRPTRFFREPELLAHLRRTLFADRMAERFGDPLRIWVVGCGTGEEAYSLAITVAEVAATAEREIPVKVLATDMDERALEWARAGIYTDEIRLDVPLPQLKRHFVQTADGRWRISSTVRDLCTFGRHDPLSDPPFSQLDLVWCHGLLEHLDPVSVRRLLPRLHHALKESGHAFFGGIERPGVKDLFEPVEGAERLYARRPARGPIHLPLPSRSESSADARRLDLPRVTDRALLDRFAPPAVVIDADWNILLFRGQTAPYVSTHPGRASFNLEHMVNPELLPEIRRLMALAREGQAVRSTPVPIRRSHGTGIVYLDVVSLTVGGGRLWLVTFEETVGQLEPLALQGTEVWADRVARLQREVEEVRRSLGARLRAREEELASVREELASVSEQVRTTLQDLARTKRELELAHQELRDRTVALASANEELQALLSAVELPLVTVDTELRVARVTPAATELLHIRPTDVGRPIGQLGKGHFELEGAMREALISGRSCRREMMDAAGHPWMLSLQPMRAASGRITGALLLALDGGPSRAERRVAEAEAAVQARDEFLAMLAHELRNPLATLQSVLQLLQRPSSLSSPEWALETAQRQVRHLARLVDDLLDASQLTRDKLEPRLEHVDLLELVRRVVQLHHPSLEQAGLWADLQLPAEPVWLLADPTRLEQILANMLQNAIRYSFRGSCVHVCVQIEASTAVLRVRDEGMGIAPEMLPRVFDLFVHGRGSSTGLGIGLTIVKRLVELHGGSVAAYSEGLGHGSEFVVRLPLQPPPSRDRRPEEPPLVRPVPRRVLLVDDNRDATDALARLLQHAGHEVWAAYDGASALGALSQPGNALPEVVFLDIGLPGMDGYEIAREIRLRLGARAPRLVALTGYGAERDRVKTREVGFDAHLVKPLAPEIMERLLLDPAAADGAL